VYILYLLSIFGLSHDTETVPTILLVCLKMAAKLKHVALYIKIS